MNLREAWYNTQLLLSKKKKEKVGKRYDGIIYHNQ